MHKYTYIYMRTYTHTYTYIYVCIYIHIYTHMCMHTHMYIHIYICMHMYVHTYVYTYVHIYIHICMYGYVYVCIHVYACMYMYLTIYKYRNANPISLFNEIYTKNWDRSTILVEIYWEEWNFHSKLKLKSTLTWSFNSISAPVRKVRTSLLSSNKYVSRTYSYFLKIWYLGAWFLNKIYYALISISLNISI